MGDSFLELVNNQKILELAELQKCNEYTKKYGLILSNKEINNILERRIEVLRETGRIEFRGSIINKIIEEFCDSPYIFQNNYAETIYELIEIFYNYKNETMDLITDDELIKFMKEAFDGICQGDLDYLSGTVLYNMRDNVLNGKPLDYKQGEDTDFE